MKKTLSLMIALVLVISTGTVALAQANDYEKNWAKDEISYMMEKGVLAGYPDGTFRPQNNMTQAEFYRVTNELLGLSGKGQVTFSDVKADAWYYGEVEKGLGAKYILPGEKLNPDANITRGEVARILTIVFDVEKDEKAAETFKDNAKFSKEAKGIIGGLKKLGLVAGFPDGTFRAQADITRAEVVKMLSNFSGKIINTAGQTKGNITSNALTNTDGVVLKDMIVDGDLYLTEGIGEGSVSLDNVTVKGHLSIKGGGVNTIYIKNSSINTISVNKQEKPVRVVFEDTKVEAIQSKNQAVLEFKEESKIKKLELGGKTDLKIEKDSSVDEIEVLSKDVNMDVEGTIGSITSEEDIVVNGKTLDSDKEFEVKDGKVEEVKESSTSGSQTSGPSYNYSSSSSSSKSKSGIVSKYRSRLERLEKDSTDELKIILNKARADVDKNDKEKSTIIEISNKYMPEAEKLETQTDLEVNSILANLETELKDNGYGTEVVANLKAEYKNKKKIKEQEIRNEFKADIQAILEILFSN